MFTRIIAQIRKELTQIVRDRLALTLALVLPVLLLLLLGKAISLNPTDLPIIVQDLDQTPLSREYIDAFRSSLTFRVVSAPPDLSLEEALAANKARAALVIPTHFAQDIRRGRATEVQMMVDATDTNTANQIRGYTGMVTRAYTQRIAPPGSQTGVRAAVRLWYNPGREAEKFFGPGIFVLGLSIFPPLLAALAMSREGEQKTILQVYVSSISAFEFVLGKVLAYWVVGLVEWALLVIVAVPAFGLHFAGDPTPFLAGTAVFLFCVASFGTLVGAAIPNMAAAIQAVSLGGFLLAFLLSGLIFPVQNIPAGLRWISNLVQSRYYIEIVRDVFLQGGGWPAMWRAVLAIGLIGLFFFGLAWRKMRKMQVDV